MANGSGAKRACDSCHRRKIKCLSEGHSSTCRNCRQAGLACTYNSIPQKKGPKGSRAKVINELREAQSQHNLLPPVSFDVHGRPARTPGVLTHAILERCLDFLETVHYLYPFLALQDIRGLADKVGSSLEAYCTVTALCANLLIQSGLKLDQNVVERHELMHVSSLQYGDVLLKESMRMRAGLFNWREQPSYSTILTSWFYYGCYYGLGKESSAWLFLQEAISQAWLLGFQNDETFERIGTEWTWRVFPRRTFFWTLFVQERAHGLHKHRPISLSPSIRLPAVDNQIDLTEPERRGLNMLLDLYKPFDEQFFKWWNKVQTPDVETIKNLQQQLGQMLPAPEYLTCPEAMAANLRITQLWLHIMVWQLCVENRWLTSMAEENFMQFSYPIEVSTKVFAVLEQTNTRSLELLGAELMEKLFDIAYCLTDVIAGYAAYREHVHYVSRFCGLFAELHGGNTTYNRMLNTKVRDHWPDLSIGPQGTGGSHAMHPSVIPAPVLPGQAIVPSNAAQDIYGTFPPGPTTYSLPDLNRQISLPTIPPQFSPETAHQAFVPGQASMYDQPPLHGAGPGYGAPPSAPGSQADTPGGGYDHSPGHTPTDLHHPAPHETHRPGIHHPSSYDARFPSLSYVPMMAGPGTMSGFDGTAGGPAAGGVYSPTAGRGAPAGGIRRGSTHGSAGGGYVG